MKKITKHLASLISISLVMTNIFKVDAGNGASSQRKGMTSSTSSSSISSMRSPSTLVRSATRSASSSAITPEPTSAGMKIGCFMCPADDSVLKKYVKRAKPQTVIIPDETQGEIHAMVDKLSQAIDAKQSTHKTGTRILTFIKDAYSDVDTVSVIGFAKRMSPDIKVSTPTTTSTDIICRYADFITKAYKMLHSNKLLNYSQQFQALQMIFSKLKERGKYMLEPSHTDRILSLDSDKVTNFAFTLIREPINPILQPGDLAILVEFPDVALLYSIR